MKFVLASNNIKKLGEMRAILSDMGMEVISQSEAGVNVEVEETGESFEENALLKAETVMRAANMPAIADDSGLSVDALGGRPGVYSARFGGDGCKSDHERCEYLLRLMENEVLRKAAFVSVIVCAFPDGRRISARGECRGEILREFRGAGGFGYDPLFFVPEYGQTMAEMDAGLKNSISHRARALRELKIKLEKSDLK